MSTKILLVEDHDIVRQGVRALLQNEPALKVVGEASNGTEALEAVRQTDPDVILMDLNMPEMSGLQCTKLIKKQFPGKKVLVLSMHDHESYLIEMLECGATGFVLKSAPKEELIFAIRRVAAGGVYVSPEFTLNIIAKYKSAMQDQPMELNQLSITPREMDVLSRVAQGKTNLEIAQELYTSVRTIETRRKNLLDKTKTKNTAALIRFAVKSGLVG